MNAPLRTACPYCGVGCGVLAAPGVAVAGDPAHPANRGRLCVKGSALHETTALGGRLLYPEVRGARVDWNAALAEVAARLGATLAEHGPESVALYLSGQLLTEDYYVANKLWKGFVGSANVDTNSRLCMSSAVVAHTRAFGEDAVPGCYEDLELADQVVMVGSNAAWAHPVLHQRLLAARSARPGTRLVVIDPRLTDSCAEADLHLALRPGSDAWLWNGLLVHLADHGGIEHDYLDAHTRGFAETLAAARMSSPDIATVAARCALAPGAVQRFYAWFAATPRTVTLFSQGVNQSSSGSDKGNAIINAHLATGRVGRPGASPFSITGQPNAMGGREVGGLASMLAAHRGFDAESVAAVGRFWGAPAMATKPGLKAIDMFRAIEDGRIRFLWVIATNPLVSLPDTGRWKDALARCPTVVVSDCVRHTDTTALADVLLPAAAWGEKDGTVTNSERCITRQRAFLPVPGEARPDWWALCEVARRLGHGSAFAYREPREIFVEHAALSALNRSTPLAFDIGELATLDARGYAEFEPRPWPAARPGQDARRLFGDGRFATADGRARLLPIMPELPAPDPELPFVLNTGRVRDHWHTLTRTANSPRLTRHRAEPQLDIGPADAARLSLADGDIAELANAQGRLRLRVRIEPGQAPGELFAPMHWSDSFASAAAVNLLAPALVDPHSGQPQLKHTPVALRRWPIRWQALLFACERLQPARRHYWARVPLATGELHLLAGVNDPAHALAELQVLPGAPAELRLSLDGSREVRLGWFDGARLAAVLLFARGAALPEPWWIGEQLGQVLDENARAMLLSAEAAGDMPAQGAIVCSCHQVGENAISAAIAAGCASTTALGERLRCGTNCGSCVPELQRLLRVNSGQHSFQE